jgi:hypothetical protein
MDAKWTDTQHSQDETHIKLHVCREFHKLCREFGHTDYRIEVRVRTRGRCSPRRRLVTLPKWALKMGHEYTMYYMLHEFAHVLTVGHLHDSVFKAKEDELLARYGLRVERKKCYPKALYAGERKVR